MLDIGFGAGGTAYYLAQHCAGANMADGAVVFSLMMIQIDEVSEIFTLRVPPLGHPDHPIRMVSTYTDAEVFMCTASTGVPSWLPSMLVDCHRFGEVGHNITSKTTL